MTTLHIMCGLPGSGKTTFARALCSQQPALLISEDAWMARLFGSEQAGNDDLRKRVGGLQWDLSADVLRRGLDVVLDSGCWFRAERDAFQERATALGVQCTIWYLDTPLDQIRSRLAARNRDRGPDTFEVRPEQIDAWSRVFEPPSREEAVRVVRPEGVPDVSMRGVPTIGI